VIRGRASGLPLHVTSLPSPYGIGDLGPGSLSWIDRLAAAGQSWWQSLPLGPTSYGNSPYQPSSSLAGRDPHSFPEAEVDYNGVIRLKHQLLERSRANCRAGARADLGVAYQQFCDEQAHWLNDYALFRAVKVKFQGAYYVEWPKELVEREPEALHEDGKWLVFLSFPQGTTGHNDKMDVELRIVPMPGWRIEGVESRCWR